MHNIALPPWAGDLAKLAAEAAKIVLPPFVPRKGVTIETDPKATKASSVPSAAAHVDDDAVIDALVAKLTAAAGGLPPSYRLAPVTFEKDDDTNYHMDAIAGLANMRARNYR